MILVEKGKQLICGNSSGFQHIIHGMNILGGDNGNLINNKYKYIFKTLCW